MLSQWRKVVVIGSDFNSVYSARYRFISWLSVCKQVFLSFSLQQGFPAVSIYYLTVALYMYVISVFSIELKACARK